MNRQTTSEMRRINIRLPVSAEQTDDGVNEDAGGKNGDQEAEAGEQAIGHAGSGRESLHEFGPELVAVPENLTRKVGRDDE